MNFFILYFFINYLFFYYFFLWFFRVFWGPKKTLFWRFLTLFFQWLLTLFDQFLTNFFGLFELFSIFSSLLILGQFWPILPKTSKRAKTPFVTSICRGMVKNSDFWPLFGPPGRGQFGHPFWTLFWLFYKFLIFCKFFRFFSAFLIFKKHYF